MCGPEGNSYFCFPDNPDFSRDEVEANIRTQGKTKLASIPRDHTLSTSLYIWSFPLNNHIAIMKNQRQQNVF